MFSEDESKVLDVSTPTHTSIIKTAVRLVTRAASIRKVVSSQEIFSPFKQLVEELPLDDEEKVRRIIEMLRKKHILERSQRGNRQCLQDYKNIFM